MLCPACKPATGIDLSRSVISLIWHLNDAHNWTRAQIAEFIAPFEPAETNSAIAETKVAVGETDAPSGETNQAETATLKRAQTRDQTGGAADR